MALSEHPSGNYQFLPGIAPYSCGVVASEGYEIVHVTLRRPVPYRAGFDRIETRLRREARPLTALCAVELRSPRPFTFEGFSAFNAEYAEILKAWNVFVDGVNPVARTNVAPAIQFPEEPVLHGYSYTRPMTSGIETPRTFIVAGAGELPEGVLNREGIVRLGESSPDAIAEKANFVMELMEQRLRGLGADWTQVTTMNVYTIHSLDRILPDVVLFRARTAARHGIHWYYTRPPVFEIEFEMDMRGVACEIVE
jgi:hypothetical protein